MKKSNLFIIAVLVVFIVVISIPTWLPKDDCEVAIAGNKCASFKAIMLENCNFLRTNTTIPAQKTELEWYVTSLCNLQNQYHNSNWDCTDVNTICNTVIGDYAVNVINQSISK